MKLLKHYLYRTAYSLLSLAGAITLVFLMTHLLPGNPLIARVTMASPDTVEQINRQLGLDRPLIVQFMSYVGGLLQGDLGTSWVTNRPVWVDLKARLPVSLELGVFSTILAVAVGLPLGIVAAVKQESWVDHFARGVASLGLSMPVFWLGLVLIYVFYFQLGVAAPPLGRLGVRFSSPETVTGFMTLDTLIAGDFDAFANAVSHAVLPTVSLAVIVLAPITRITRATMLEVLQQDYINTARAVGMPYYRILLHDALQNSMVAILTVAGLVFGYLVAGSLLIERVFAWPGIGLYAFNALVNNDFAAIQGFIIVTSVLYIAINWLVDLLYGVIDPRIRI